MKRRLFPILLPAALLLCALLLCGCGTPIPAQELSTPAPTPEPTPVPTPEPIVFAAGSFRPEAEELTLVLEEGESPLLESFPALKSLDLRGSRCYAEILDYAERHPEVELLCDVELPDGTVLDNTAEEADLSTLRHEEAEDALFRLRLLSALQRIDLGERSEEDPDRLSWEDVGAFQAAFPEAAVDYRFTLFDKTFSVLDEQMIISQRKMDDQGAAVLEVLPYMTRCTYLDMDSCGVDNEHMAVIRDAFPDIKVVWRVWFGEDYTVRTDVKRILASSEGRRLDDYCCEGLYYCRDVVWLDIGHSQLYDLSFLYNMPDLEVLIVACAPWNDPTPIGSLEKLEYLEVLSTNCDNVEPFANLHNLKHLNIGNCWRIYDVTPLYEMTQLERLWIGCVTPVPDYQKREIREKLPDTLINTTTAFHKNEGWCKDDWGHNVPRYALLREQFGDYQIEAYAYDWVDPLCYKSLDELTEEELERAVRDMKLVLP